MGWWVAGVGLLSVLVSSLVAFVLFVLLANKVCKLEKRVGELEAGASKEGET